MRAGTGSVLRGAWRKARAPITANGVSAQQRHGRGKLRRSGSERPRTLLRGKYKYPQSEYVESLGLAGRGRRYDLYRRREKPFYPWNRNGRLREYGVVSQTGILRAVSRTASGRRRKLERKDKLLQVPYRRPDQFRKGDKGYGRARTLQSQERRLVEHGLLVSDRTSRRVQSDRRMEGTTSRFRRSAEMG